MTFGKTRLWIRTVMLTAAAIGMPISLQAQADVTDLVRCFSEAQLQNSFICEDPPQPYWSTVLTTPDEYVDGLLPELLTGLEELASGSDRRLSASAVSWMSTAARHQSVGDDAIRALQRVFSGVHDPGLREGIVSGLAGAGRQSEGFRSLERIIADHDSKVDQWSPIGLALFHLQRAGPEGEASLRRLHSGSVRSEVVRQRLDEIVRGGVRPPF